ncbi:MAG TPA: hypothetical protein VFO85_00255, partial [Vicinamibacteria bacterium]|nr:hypothetical protein [Vicinamibacteria bacterium]
MEALILFVVLLALTAPVLAVIAIIRGEAARRRVRGLEGDLRALEARVAVLARRAAAAPADASAEAVSEPPPPE